MAKSKHPTSSNKRQIASGNRPSGNDKRRTSTNKKEPKSTPKSLAASNISSCENCGGCKYLGMSYEDSLKKKQEYVEGLLRKAVGAATSSKASGASRDFEILPIIGADNPYHYRSKVHAAFASDRRSGKVISGMYVENTHKIVSSDGCLVENQKATAIVQTITRLVSKYHIPVFNEDTCTGIFRRVLIRLSEVTGEVMVVLVLGTPSMPRRSDFMEDLLKEHPEITSILFNQNRRRDSMILGDKYIVKYGKGYILDEICGVKFKVSPDVFVQVNHAQTEKLYSEAIGMLEDAIAYDEKLANKKQISLLDTYCGIGTIGLVATSKCKRFELTGVELNKSSVRDAIGNAKHNGITNAHFIACDATEYMSNNAQKGKSSKNFDVVILDPPRSGTTPEFVDACKKLAPRHIVYISCNPETLARDLVLFEKGGFKLEKARAVDMFPWTMHVETVCLLGRRKPDDVIEVEIE